MPVTSRLTGRCGTEPPDVEPGGYVAARIAKHDERLNGALSAWLCMLSGIYSWVSGAYTASGLAHIGHLVLSPALGAFGGYLFERTKNKPHATGLTSAAA